MARPTASIPPMATSATKATRVHIVLAAAPSAWAPDLPLVRTTGEFSTAPTPSSSAWYARGGGARRRAAAATDCGGEVRGLAAACCCMSHRPWSVPYASRCR
eukprot:scaffold2489_cov110-Isochrysis_galbana.AAC.14